ncbi:MAG: hypothetical protein GF311_16525 [Candidatus Lokiarchaeota archaeon]|nr:hypothetical protein [Candidatus Lokiarchaeota archaeon]
MYCKKCGCEVPTKREDIDWFLLVILAIFTAGFGVLIYLAIYFDKPENRCVYCNSVCIASNEYQPYEPARNTDRSTSTSADYPTKQVAVGTAQKDRIIESFGKFCSSCGAKLDERGKVNFCAYCGFDLS